jgi:predicted phosphodiesterase
MQGPKYAYLHGNHDAVARADGWAQETLRIEEDGWVIFFVHGHQYDPLLQRAWPLAQASTWFSGRLRNYRLNAIADWLEHQDIKIRHAAFQGEKGPYVAAASSLLKQHQADVVLMGHTHVPERLQLAEGIFANTGTCSMRLHMHVSIDTKLRSVQLHRGTQTADRS